MTTPTGAIGLSDVNIELGKASNAAISLNDSDVRSLAGIPSGAIALSDLRGKSNAFTATISSNQLQLDLRTWALANGWNGTSKAIITINTGVYIYSNSTATPALTISGSWPNGVEIINKGFVLGKGGNSGAVGGPAISLGLSVTINNTLSTAYIGGGGGGGGASWGGGGAGGGNGNPAVGASGSNGSVGVGGGGGRIIPGTGGASVTGSSVGGLGGGAGGGGGISYAGSGIPQHSSGILGCNYSYIENTTTAGGGGGGWGASGGQTRSSTFAGIGTRTSGAGGSANNVGGNSNGASLVANGSAGGKAVNLNGYSVTWTSGDTARVYGAVS
jgi:hypothetical protein